jgi:hypothetical protein
MKRLEDREALQFALILLTFFVSAVSAYRIIDLTRMVADIYERLHGLGLGG